MTPTAENMLEMLTNVKTTLRNLEEACRQHYLETDITAFWMAWCFVQMAINDIGGAIWSIKAAQQKLKDKSSANIT